MINDPSKILTSDKFLPKEYNKQRVDHLTKYVLFVLLAFLTISCGSNSTGTNGGGGGNNGGGEEPPPEPTFTNVQSIFTDNCGNCHIGNRQNGVRLDGYDNVIESEGTQYGGLIVVSGEPDNSPLVDKIEPDPDFGDRMPRGRSPLSNEEISLIREWISEGAENN